MPLVFRHVDPQNTWLSFMLFTKYFHLSVCSPGRAVQPRLFGVECGHEASIDQLAVSKCNSLQDQTILVAGPKPSRIVSPRHSNQEPLIWLVCKGNQEPVSQGIGDEQKPSYQSLSEK